MSLQTKHEKKMILRINYQTSTRKINKIAIAAVNVFFFFVEHTNVEERQIINIVP